MLAEEVPAKLELSLPTYRDTFLASSIGSMFLFAGLIAFSISEASLPGVRKDWWFVLLFRMIGWVALYFIPVQLVGVGNLRGFCLWGVEPSNASLVCWKTAMGPENCKDMAEEMGLNGRRAFAGSCFIGIVFLLLWTSFFLVYLGPVYQHCGFILAYGVGHLLLIAISETIAPHFFPPPLDERYAQKMGPATLGPAIVGFFICTTGYRCLKRFAAGSWLGTLMPVMLSGYELGNLVIVQRTFLAEFVTEKPVRRKYLMSNQAILVSTQICFVHCMAEGARMTLILAAMSHEGNQNFEFLVPTVSGMVWNIAVRAGMLDRALAIVTCGRRTPTRCSLLLQEVKYCMGYPRFFVLLAVVLARVCARNPVLPCDHENMGLAVLALFLAEVVEDLISYLLEWLDFKVHPKRRQVTEEEFEMMARAQLRFSLGSDEASMSAVVPSATWAAHVRSEDFISTKSDMSLKDKCWRLRQRFAFSYGEPDLGILPFWANFSAVIIAQFHTLLFMILLGNGLNFVLGFCHGELEGFDGALLWWPLTDPNDLCGEG